jgi:hypothetical protein
VFFTYTNEPAFQPVPVLNAGVLGDDDPMLLLIKHSKFNGYVGAADVLYRSTLFVELVILTTLVGLAIKNVNMCYLTSGMNEP